MVRPIAGDDEDPTDLEISELVSVSITHFEAQLLVWKHSREPHSGAGGNLDDVELDAQPSGIDLGRARAFYNAARIHARNIFNRDHSNELWMESHKAATAPPAAPAPPTVRMVRPPMSPDRNVDGDMVSLGNVIDGRKGREIAVVSAAIYSKGLEWYAYA